MLRTLSQVNPSFWPFPDHFRSEALIVRAELSIGKRICPLNSLKPKTSPLNQQKRLHLDAYQGNV